MVIDMKLGELLKNTAKAMPAQINASGLERIVMGITDNTEEVKPGWIFVCVKGTKFDGHSAAEDMIKKGALCVIADHDLGITDEVIVSDTRLFYGHLCAEWFGHPEKKLRLIGVTGTNGKTTMTTLIKDILSQNGVKVGFIGTTGVLINGKPYESDQSTPTTPRVFELYSIFFEMLKQGITTVVMEVSSFALEQNRIGPAIYDCAVFTNLTQDHLDYHGDMENYYNAKKKLFTHHCKTAIINLDDKYGRKLWDELGNSCEKISYGVSTPQAEIRGDNIRSAEGGTKFWISVNNKSFPAMINMIGNYNVSNAVAAVTVCLKLELSINNIILALGHSKGVRGRCEILSSSRGFLVICDYAHSPDALENMLSNIKEHTKGRLICLFGCGGDRDRTKRPLMAHAAEKYSDFVIVTSDNPRNEQPDAIIDEIVTGLSGIKPYIRITDRKAAIKRAIALAEKGDTIVLAGKGHEDYQILKDNVHIHFDEREIVEEIMRGYKKPAFNPNCREELTFTEIIDAIGGVPKSMNGQDPKVYADAIFSDTRNIIKGGVFVAIKGERFDGHDFVEEAIKKGAAYAITEREIGDCPCVIVKSTRKALLDIAHHFRMKFSPVVVGITGSVGKTTTKNMTALALSSEFAVYKTEKNHNNEIGLPFTLLKLNSSCTAAVIEMGMSDFGEIERLSRATYPTICLITNIGDSHMEKLGSREGILEAKMEIIKGADRKAPLILNGDDKLLWRTFEDYGGGHNIITYGIENESCDYVAKDIEVFEDRMYFNIYHNGEVITDAALFCVGKHNIYNALAAVTVAAVAGADPVSAAEMLSGYQADPLRQHIQKRGEQTILVDCYNASPTSMKAAVDMLCDMTPKEGGRRVAVLGDMLELGEKSKAFHAELGEYIVSKNVDMLVCYGTESKYIAERANELGMHAGYASEMKTILNFLKFKLKPNDVVLFKASRGIHLEEVIDEFYKDC